MSRKPEDRPLDFSQVKAPVSLSTLFPSIPSRSGSRASSVLLGVSRDTDIRAPAFILRLPALLPSVPFVTGSSASSVLLEVSRDTDIRAPAFIFRSTARLMEVERLAASVEKVLMDFKVMVLDALRAVLKDHRDFYRTQGGMNSVEAHHLSAFIAVLKAIRETINHQHAVISQQRTLSDVLIQGTKSVAQVSQGVRRVQALLTNLVKKGNVNSRDSTYPYSRKMQLGPDQLTASFSGYRKYQQRLKAIQDLPERPRADGSQETGVNWSADLPTLFSALQKAMTFRLQQIQRRSDRLALLFSGKWKDGERASLVQPLSHWSNELGAMLDALKEKDCPRAAEVIMLLKAWLSNTPLTHSLFLWGDAESPRLQKQLIDVLSQLDSVVQEQAEKQTGVEVWQQLLSALATHEPLVSLLPPRLQRQVLHWDWPQGKGDSSTDHKTLAELQSFLMGPLTDYATTKAREYGTSWLGGKAVKQRVEAAAERLSALPALVVYRWSGALIHLLLEKDEGRARVQYKALVVDWLADGGSASLGKALRSTPWFSFAPLYSDPQMANEILHKHSSLPFQLGDLGERTAWLQSLGRQPYLPVVLETVLSQLRACGDRFTAWLSEQEEAGPLSAKEAAQASGFQAALTRLQRQLRYEVSLEPGRLIEQVQEVMMGFREGWHLYLYCQFEGRSEDCLGLFRAAERHLVAWQKSQTKTAYIMQRALEQVIHAAAAVGGGAAAEKSVEGHLLETLKHLLLGLGGAHKLLVAGNHLISGLRVGEHLLSTMELTEGLFETNEATFALISGSPLGHRLKHWYEKKTGDLSVKSQLKHVADAFPSMEEIYPRVQLLVKRILQVYSNQFASLKATSQMALMVYITGMVLAYIKYGLASPQVGTLSDDEFADDLVGWLVFADYALLTRGRLSRVLQDVSLILQSGDDVKASALLGQAGLLCQDGDGQVFRFWTADQKPGALGYRLALPYEVQALNEDMREKERSGRMYRLPPKKRTPIVIHMADEVRRYHGDFKALSRDWPTTQERDERRYQELDVRVSGTEGVTSQLVVTVKKQAEEIGQLRAGNVEQKLQIEALKSTVRIQQERLEALEITLYGEVTVVLPAARPHPADSSEEEIPEEESEAIEALGQVFEGADEDPANLTGPLPERHGHRFSLFDEQAVQRAREEEVTPTIAIEHHF